MLAKDFSRLMFKRKNYLLFYHILKETRIDFIVAKVSPFFEHSATSSINPFSKIYIEFSSLVLAFK